MARCLLALGSNLGDRHAILAQACTKVAKLPSCQLLARSRWHDTVPIGGAAGQGEFLNGALLLETTRRPQALAADLQQVETALGRQRGKRWDSRTLDIDMLLYGQEVIDDVHLTVPHPRMSFRKFVLEPAAEIVGPMLHPTSGWTIARLLAHLQNSPRYVVVTATEKPIAEWLVSQLSQKLHCPTELRSDKNGAKAGVPQPCRGIQFPKDSYGIPPVVSAKSPYEIGANESQKHGLTPALVIAIDVSEPKILRAEAASAGFVAGQEETPAAPDAWLDSPTFDFSGVGPLARITLDDPATAFQESQAALRCIWPDLT